MQVELKEARARYGKTLAECAAVLGCTIEGYRLKEIGRSPVHGAELARLADLYGVPLREAFPSYKPTEGEAALVRHMQGVA